ncbi:hypothetical protein LG329_18815 [Virgibacillus necropolis]|uniref:hypothetical protein n=1 Tax=Virgibacillus necropolis TaxID=163877 RepID=UPI00384C5CAD
MKKYKLILYIVPIAVIAILFFVWNGVGKATLVANQGGSKKIEDFILHIRVEEEDQKIKVYRSLQYIGEESIEIEHQTPLISVSLGHKNHDFTGSKVKEDMTDGDSYYPQKAKTIKIPKKGRYTLYCIARFEINGREKTIEHTEELVFE